MTRIRRHLTSPGKTPDEGGMTLVELMVAMTLMVMITPIFGSVMVSSLRATNDNIIQSSTTDELRQQLYAITRELRSATCIAIPTPGQVGPGNTLKFRVIDTATGNPYFLTYVVSGGQLSRTDDRTGSVRAIGPGLVSPATTFTLVSTPKKSIIVILKIQLDPGRSVQELDTTIAGRNAWPAAC